LTQSDEIDWIEQAFAPTGEPGWLLEEASYDTTREAGIEARFAIGNGFIGVRAARSVSRGPTWSSYLQFISWASWPRTYIAGLFDTPNTEPPVPALVPAPDWLRVRIWIDEELALIRSGTLLSHGRCLDMRRGVLLTEWRQRLPSGRVLGVRSLRFVSQADRALGVQILDLEVDGPPTAVRLAASFEESGSALERVSATDDVAVWCTTHPRKWLALASWSTLRFGDTELATDHADPVNPLNRQWCWTSKTGRRATLLRTAAFARGEDDDDTRARAVAALDRARQQGVRRTLIDHEQAWAQRWADSDVEVEGDPHAQRALRFAIYHLISAANPEDDLVSVGARALTGDAYLGHVFWDTEIYLLPFYILTWPEAARALLLYRYHTLPGARRKAEQMGYRGAFYAWESADTGDETTPAKIVDPNGRVIDILCGKQEWHIVADVAYAVWQYWQATGDDSFMLEAGAEIMLETARFWASAAALEPDGRFHIRNIIGPDEYHEEIDDNAYTNVMARWTLERAAEIIELLQKRWPPRWRELQDRLAIGHVEQVHWRDVAARLAVRYDPATKLLEQFEGYFRLEEIDVASYEGRTVPMDVILGRERTQRSQVVKQADVVALLALLPERFDRPTMVENFRYYEPRCGHGSSLSHAMHALVAARVGEMNLAWRSFLATAAIDLGPTTVASAGGVRIAAQGGLWMAAVLGFAGLSQSADELRLQPALPEHWRSMAFRTRWRGRRLHLRITRDPQMITAVLEDGEPMTLHVGDEVRSIGEGATVQIPWNAPLAELHGATPPQ
jgi:trehalose/maltose hydrolase-like predicted phosphorylase